MVDHKSQVLAARVLSYLKRRAAKGNAPSRHETHAAVAALQLLASSLQGAAGNASALFNSLQQIAQKNNSAPPQRADFQDSMNYGPEVLSFQQAMDRLNKMSQMTSNIVKTQADAQNAIINNIR